MTIHQSLYARGSRQAPYPQIAGCATTHRFAMDVPTDVAANDILELASIPPGVDVMDISIDIDDLDAGAGIVFDVGIMSGDFGSDDAGRTCGDEFFAASTLGQAGGVERASKVSAFRVPKSNVARSVGVKVSTVAATPQAGSIGITLTVAAT